jgi:hypothetical protein
MSSKKSNNIMSLSIDLETQDKLKTVAKKRNISVSKLIRDMVEKNLSVTDEDVDTVILKIPNSFKVTEVSLRSWLTPRFENIVKALAMDISQTGKI